MNLIGGTAQIWRGGLGLDRGDGRQLPADLPPVAAPDAALALAGSTVRIDVLGNDADPESRTLTVTGASAGQGSVAVNPDGSLSYDAPADASGRVTLAYTVADPAGNTEVGAVSVDIVRLLPAEGEFALGSSPEGVAISVVAPSEYAGDHVLDPEDLASGPVSLVPPRILGTVEAGEPLTAGPGLWAGTDASLAVTRQWLRGATPIPGETGSGYVVDVVNDAGRTLHVVETASTAAGTRAATSAGIDVPAAGTSWTPVALPGLALWLDASDAGTVTLSGNEVVHLADKSGNGRNAARVSGSPAPTLDAALNDTTILRFPVNGILRSAGATLPGLPGMPGVTVIAVTQAHVTTSFKACVSLRNGDGGAGQYIFFQTGFSVMWFGNGNRYWTLPPSGPVVEVARYPENGTHGGTEWWRNGEKLAVTSSSKTGNSVTLPADAFVQFGTPDGQTSEQAECLVLIGPLSDADRQKAEGYLAHRWGLAAQLPDGHPYKAAPPAA